MTVSKNKPPRKGASAGEPSNYSKLYKSSAAGAGVNAAPTPAKVTKKSSAAETPSAPVARDKDTVDWRGEYGYVLSDLRRLGLVTLGLVIAIVIAGFFL